MNRKPALYTSVGIFTGSAVTAVVLLLTVRPLFQVSQAQSNPALSDPSSQTVPRMWRMMEQPEQHFIVMMIPHHEGAIAMADLALERSQRPEILALAESIKDTQAQEIEQMRDWYQQWYDADVPQWTPGVGRMNWDESELDIEVDNWTPLTGRHHNRRPHDRRYHNQWMVQADWQPGIHCLGTMFGNPTTLEDASDFDRAFIEEMIPHHQMGVMMAQMVLIHSDRPEIQELAEAIIDAQTSEIDQMQQWYEDWYSVESQ